METNTNTLQLKSNDLYQNGRVFILDNGDRLLLREVIEVEGYIGDTQHVLKKGEQLDYLSWTYYKGQVEDASKLLWVIADANNIINPLYLDDLIGTRLLIPNVHNFLLKAEST